MWRYFIAWFPMVLIAIANGALREFVFKGPMGDLHARQLSTVTLLILFTLYVWFILRAWPPVSDSQALLIGVIWLVLTLAFEFGFGRLTGKSWEFLLAEYNIFAGRIWVLIPLWVLIAPYILYRIRK